MLFLPLLTAFGFTCHPGYRFFSLLSAFLALNAIRQCYQRNSSRYLPLSTLLAATNAICQGYQCYSCRPSFRLFLPSSLCCTRISEPFLPPMTAPSFSRLSPLCCSATACASSAEFHSRFPLSAFLAVNAICQCYQRNSYCCLPLSALLAATDAICLGFQCYPSLSLPLSVVLAVSAICLGYECYPSHCLPFSVLLAVKAIESSCHLPSAALGSPSRSSRR
jgi:hypothetical protein